MHGPHYRGRLVDEDWQIWHAIEELHDSGKVRVIGVSNVSADQLAEFCAHARVKPMVVQNRCYASTGWDHQVRQICSQQAIVYQGFSLLTANMPALRSRQIREIAARVNATPAQIIFAFAIQMGMLPLTGTTSAQHMQEDLQATAIELWPAEIELIETIGL